MQISGPLSERAKNLGANLYLHFSNLQKSITLVSTIECMYLGKSTYRTKKGPGRDGRSTNKPKTIVLATDRFSRRNFTKCMRGPFFIVKVEGRVYRPAFSRSCYERTSSDSIPQIEIRIPDSTSRSRVLTHVCFTRMTPEKRHSDPSERSFGLRRRIPNVCPEAGLIYCG
jgi:hypothetical protein